MGARAAQAKELQIALERAKQRLRLMGADSADDEAMMEKGAPGVVAQPSAEMDSHADAEVAEVGSVLQLLLRAQALWTSPQCRALQTAMVALRPLTCGGALPIEIKSYAREQRGVTNFASVRTAPAAVAWEG